MEKNNIYIGAILTTISGIITAWANKYPELAMEILGIVLISIGLLMFTLFIYKSMKQQGSPITEAQFFLMVTVIVVAVWSLVIAAGEVRKSYKAVEREPGRWEIVED